LYITNYLGLPNSQILSDLYPQVEGQTTYNMDGLLPRVGKSEFERHLFDIIAGYEI
jgi:hypothetical protein